jgi:putative DNA primase/helicase
MLGNGAGKDRGRPGGGNRRLTTFLTLVLSSAEESPGRLTEQAGQRAKAGQEVRMIDVPAVVPGGFGCFEALHGEADGAAFVAALRRAVVAHHGHAGPAFVDRLATALTREPDLPRTLIEQADA